MDQHRAAVADPGTPVADVASGRRIPVCPVDVEHVDRAVDLAECGIRERPDVAHPIADAGAFEVGKERLVVVGGGGFESADLLRTAVVAGMRVDGDDVDTRRSRARQHDGRTALEATDLDDGAPIGAVHGGGVEGGRLSRRHPPPDIGDAGGHRCQVGPGLGAGFR